MDHLRCRMSSKLIVEYETFPPRSFFLLNSKFEYEMMFQHLPLAFHCSTHHDGHRWSDSVFFFFCQKCSEQTEILLNKHFAMVNRSCGLQWKRQQANKRAAEKTMREWKCIVRPNGRERERARAASRLSLKLYAAAVTKVRQWSAVCTFILGEREKNLKRRKWPRGDFSNNMHKRIYLSRSRISVCH